MKKKSKKELVREVFKANPGRWISSVYLATRARSFRYGARIAELRQEGMEIVTKIEHVDGDVHSSYKFAG